MIEWAADQHGIVLRRDAVQMGVDDNALRRAVDAGVLVRIRQGAYVVAPVWQQADPAERHRLLLSAVRGLYDENVVASHVSACVEHGGPTWGMDLSSAHLTSLDGTAHRRSARVVHHRGGLRVGDVTRDATGWITAPARTALDTASLLPQDAGVAVVDWYLQRGLTTSDEIDRTFDSMRWWPETLGLHRVLQLADGRAESVGETRSRLLFRSQRLPAPIPQFEVRHPSGRVAGRVDFAWPQHRTLLEFDGMAKYHRLRRPGETLEQTVMREKQREDLLRELTGWIMIRLVWADLDRPEATAARIRRCFALAA